MLAENLIDLKPAELMIDWCADILDSGSLGTAESSMTGCGVIVRRPRGTNQRPS